MKHRKRSLKKVNLVLSPIIAQGSDPSRSTRITRILVILRSCLIFKYKFIVLQKSINIGPPWFAVNIFYFYCYSSTFC